MFERNSSIKLFIISGLSVLELWPAPSIHFKGIFVFLIFYFHFLSKAIRSDFSYRLCPCKLFFQNPEVCFYRISISLSCVLFQPFLKRHSSLPPLFCRLYCQIIHRYKKSANSLKQRVCGNKKSARRGSNPRPPPWQGGAPPLSHSRILSFRTSYRRRVIY